MKLTFIMIRLGVGGAEIQSVDLINALIQKGYSIQLICLNDETALMDRINPAVQVHVMAKASFLDFKVMKKMAGLLREFQPAIVFSVNSYAMFYGYLSRILSKIKTKQVLIQHTTILPSKKELYLNKIYVRIMNRMEKVVFVCNNQREYWEKNYGANPTISHVIYNGVDFKRFRDYHSTRDEVRKALNVTEETILLGISAVFRPEKKHEDAIDALEILLKKGYPVKLLLIGDGVRKDAIFAHVRKKKMDDKVMMTGFVQDVRPFLDALDISVICSVAVETFSISILEAMAMGKPVVASNIGGAAEQIQNGKNGYLYPAYDVESLAANIQKIMDDLSFEKMGEYSRIQVQTIFNHENMTENYVQLMEAICKEGGE